MIIILRIRDTNIEEIDSVYGRETNAFAYEWFVQLVQRDGTCSFSIGSEEGYKGTPFTRIPRKFNLIYICYYYVLFSFYYIWTYLSWAVSRTRILFNQRVLE